MEFEITTLCQAATVDGGKMNLLGAFDLLESPTPEIRLPIIHFAARLRYEDIEAGEHMIRIRFCDDEGKLVSAAVEQTVKLDQPTKSRTATFHVVMAMHNVALHAYGEYSIDLAIDRIRFVSVPLYFRAPDQK